MLSTYGQITQTEAISQSLKLLKIPLFILTLIVVKEIKFKTDKTSSKSQERPAQKVLNRNTNLMIDDHTIQRLWTVC